MNRFENILLIHDESLGFDDALTRAAILALHDNACLTIAATARPSLENATVLMRLFSPVVPLEPETRRKDLENSLAHAVGRARMLGARTKAVILEGAPHNEVLHHIFDHRYDLVMVIDNPNRTFARVFTEKLATRILRMCPCPVWVIKPHTTYRIRRIIAALEIDGTTRETDRTILSFATKLARLENCKLDIVHAWDFEGRDLETSRSELTPPLRSALYRRNHLIRARALGKVLANEDLGDVEHEVHLLKGNADAELLRFSKAHGVDLIVAGMKVRNGLDRLTFGDTLERIAPMTNGSVVAIKSATFLPEREKLPPRTVTTIPLMRASGA